MRTTATLRVGQRSTEHVFAGGQVQDVRIYARQLNAPEITGLYRAVPARHVLGLPAAERTSNQVESLYAYWLDTRDDAWQQRKRDHAALVAEQRAIRERSPVTLVQAEKTNSPATAHILFRGQYDKPKEKVTADTFAALPPMPAGAPRNRLGLARWLVSRDNPLTARVTVNRFWQEIFGLGLVRTAEDFGATGDTPIHPELLDWLAVEFQESGWDVKHLFELITSSSTYQQAAVTTPRKVELDPQNRLLSRGPRFRMDAEVLRDAALASSGLLVEKIGGPSVKPYQPPGVWEAVAMPESNTKKYQRDTGAGSYRRSLYTFWKRAAPPASMDLFNAPSRESCTVRRERTNTPLQALATLNDPQFLEAARNLARLALLAVRRDDEIPDYMARRLLSRPFTAEESAVVQQSLAAMQRHFEQYPDAATELVPGVDPAATPGLTPARLAAATMLANQLMNLDETLSK